MASRYFRDRQGTSSQSGSCGSLAAGVGVGTAAAVGADGEVESAVAAGGCVASDVGTGVAVAGDIGVGVSVGVGVQVAASGVRVAIEVAMERSESEPRSPPG